MKVSKGLEKKEITVPVMVGVMVPVIVRAVEVLQNKKKEKEKIRRYWIEIWKLNHYGKHAVEKA